jgi:hypothetical protein
MTSICTNYTYIRDTASVCGAAFQQNPSAMPESQHAPDNIYTKKIHETMLCTRAMFIAGGHYNRGGSLLKACTHEKPAHLALYSLQILKCSTFSRQHNADLLLSDAIHSTCC